MKIKLLKQASLDLVSGHHFYERQLTGLGDYFLDTLYSEIDSLVLYAGIHPKKEDYYFMLSRKFPFAIYYKMDKTNIFVYAVLDCRQNPSSASDRLKE